MRILVTNDDGFHSPGIEACLKIARELSDDVWMVAPESDQSGVAHSLSLSDPLRLRKIDERRFAVKGTPTDCVIMAVRHILADMKIGLVLSGVNKGQNIAEDVTYSGTVAGAMEGTILGIPSVALSQCYTAATRENPSYATAEKFAPDLIRKLLKTGMPEGVLVNVNFPACKPEEVVGIAVTTQGKRDPELLKIDPRFDGRNNPYYWIGFSRKQYDLPNGSDMQAVAERRISVTPLRIDLTDEPYLTQLAQVFTAPKKMTLEQERSEFVSDLKARGIHDEKVLEALARVPREEFVEPAHETLAFSDQALPIACGQTISQPYVVAAMTEALEISQENKVLEIGTGSGYQAAILSCLAREVVTIERHRDLAETASARLSRLGFNNITVVHADGMEGAGAHAPFDRILVTAAGLDIPPALTAQLAPGGILVAPVGGEGEVQTLVRQRKNASGSLQIEDLMQVRFVPLLPGG